MKVTGARTFFFFNQSVLILYVNRTMRCFRDYTNRIDIKSDVHIFFKCFYDFFLNSFSQFREKSDPKSCR